MSLEQLFQDPQQIDKELVNVLQTEYLEKPIANKKKKLTIKLDLGII